MCNCGIVLLLWKNVLLIDKQQKESLRTNWRWENVKRWKNTSKIHHLFSFKNKLKYSRFLGLQLLCAKRFPFGSAPVHQQRWKQLDQVSISRWLRLLTRTRILQMLPKLHWKFSNMARFPGFRFIIQRKFMKVLQLLMRFFHFEQDDDVSWPRKKRRKKLQIVFHCCNSFFPALELLNS